MYIIVLFKDKKNRYLKFDKLAHPEITSSKNHAYKFNDKTSADNYISSCLKKDIKEKYMVYCQEVEQSKAESKITYNDSTKNELIKIKNSIDKDLAKLSTKLSEADKMNSDVYHYILENDKIDMMSCWLIVKNLRKILKYRLLVKKQIQERLLLKNSIKQSLNIKVEHQPYKPRLLTDVFIEVDLEEEFN